MLAMYSTPVISDCIATYHSKKIYWVTYASAGNQYSRTKNMQQKAQGHTLVYWKVSTV